MPFVYFIQSGESGPIKIGYAEDDIKKRITQLQVGNPEQLNLLGVIHVHESNGLECPVSRQIENALHRAFNRFRVRGEWFRATGELLQFITANAQDDFLSHKNELIDAMNQVVFLLVENKIEKDG